MTIPKQLKPPYRIGRNTFLTTHQPRSADPATQPGHLQRIASHLPLKVRGPKPSAPTAPAGGAAAAGPSAPAPRTGQLPAPPLAPASVVPEGKGKDVRVDFMGAQKLPDELILQIVGSFDVHTLKAWREVSRLAAATGAEAMTHLNVKAGADVAKALQAFPKARSLKMPWHKHIDMEGCSAIGTAAHLRSVTLTACGLAGLGDTKLAAIARSRSINTMSVRYNAITWTGVQAVVEEGRVETLDLSGNPIHDRQHRAARGLGASESIRELAVNGCRLDDQDAAHLAASKSIVKLRVAHNRLGPTAAAAFAANGTRDAGATDAGSLSDGQPARLIEEIDLSHNPLGSAGIQALAATRTIRSMTLAFTGAADDDMRHLARCASLRTLDVSENELGPEAARHLSTSLSLEELRMCDNPRLGDAGARHLAVDDGIRVLTLKNCGIGDPGAQALAAKPGLRELSLNSNAGITDVGAQAFEFSPSLRKLELARCAVGNAGAIGLAASSSLEDLSLKLTKVGNDAAVALAEAPRLRRLVLSGNDGIDDVGGTALAASTTLREVYLSATNVGDKTAIAMARNPTIRMLDMSSCRNLTDKGRAALEAQRHRFEYLYI